MKFLLLAALLFSPIDYSKYDPEGRFEVGKYYKHPYTQIIYVKEQAVLHDGSTVIIVEQVQGRVCPQPTKVCSYPITTMKGKWIEVERID